MKTFQRFTGILLILLLACQTGWAQGKVRNDIKLDAETKAFLEDQAIARVQKFQEGCAYVASKKNTPSEKLKKIDATLELFADSARTIQITNFDGSVQPAKLVSIYLNKLMMLGYKEINITSSDFHISTELRPSAQKNAQHPGEEWYEGVVSVLQRFVGHRYEYTVIDEVERNMTVYVRKVLIVQGRKKFHSWQVFIGDIQARSVSAS